MLKYSDFKKNTMWSCNKYCPPTAAFATKDYEIKVTFDPELYNIMFCDISMYYGSIKSVAMNIDDIATIEEIENTAEALYNAVYNMRCI